MELLADGLYIVPGQASIAHGGRRNWDKPGPYHAILILPAIADQSREGERERESIQFVFLISHPVGLV
jgi:hypothetical protein